MPRTGPTRTAQIRATKFVVKAGRYVKIGGRRWKAGQEFTAPKSGTGVPRGGIDVDRLVKSGVIKEAERG